MPKCGMPARGSSRLTAWGSLPLMDAHADIRYEGSISKCGDNADWDWGLYPDENGEWVLMEASGPGCIFNFTQHRYPTSAVPVFRFYFDHSPTPQFEITPAEFGKKAPFLSPLADIFVGPEDGGRGPIWVVRSFVPLEFTTHCKVTSSTRLEGADKAKGEGGWGHITYQLYDSAEGLTPFDPAMDIAPLVERYRRLPVCSAPATERSLTLPPRGKAELFAAAGGGCLAGIGLDVPGFTPEHLSGLWVELSFDDAPQPQVLAPLGTFFGCEFGRTPAALHTALLTADFAGETAHFFNGFPMPYRHRCRVRLENRLDTPVTLRAGIGEDTAYCWQAGMGHFTASPYYPPTDNTPGQNSVIAAVAGCGHMVYGVISGYDIQCGCEGDVRVFLDGVSSPVVESDGSESWGSYGWGFVCPPQCNPFSAYNGIPGDNNNWSELRLTYTDSYPFRSGLRFELEHGCQNDGGGRHSGQVFYYGMPETAEVLCATVTPNSPVYTTDGRRETGQNRFENGIHEQYHAYTCVRDMHRSQFTVPIPADNRGIVLKRVSLQDRGRQCATVFINGQRVTERQWLFADSNPIYSLLEDNFIIPAHYTVGQEQLTVTVEPVDANWSECSYRIFAIIEKGESL